MRVVLSVQEGKIASATLLRRLSTYSRRNNIYQAFREIGRAIRTVQLLRFLSDAQLRRRTTAETDKVESYNNFSSWCRIGNAGVIAANDPAEQEKILKFSTLMTNAVIFHTTLDMMTVIRELIAEGWQITPADLAVLSPYVTARIQRFGVYATDEIALTPRTLQRPPGHRPGRRILSSPDPAPSFRNRPWRVLGLSWLHPMSICWR
jgi:type II secretory pathway pseudopilin PulG